MAEPLDDALPFPHLERRGADEARRRAGTSVRRFVTSLMAKSIPEGWQSVTPRLVVHDPAKLVQFLKEAFGASGDFAATAPSQMRIGDYVDDIDATYQRALKAGALSVEEPRDVPYGDRRAMVKDPCDNDWQIATHKGVLLEGA